MTAAPAIKGWCPTLLSPMQSGDGWLARVKPSAGCVSADAARLIADAATPPRQWSYRPHLARQFADQGTQSSLGASLRRDHHRRGPRQRQPVARSRRNVMASPLGPDDPSASFDSHVVARDIEAMLVGEPGLWALPPKFCILVDGGGVLPLADISADIMVRPGEGALTVHLDGGTRAALCAPSSLAETVKALALAFQRLSAQRSDNLRGACARWSWRSARRRSSPKPV